MIVTKQKTTVLFNEINEVFISNTKANQTGSLTILRNNGLRPLSYQEALVLIDKYQPLKEELRGKWFFLNGKGLSEIGCYTFDSKGELKEGKGDIEKTVHMHPGENPLSLDVRLCVKGFNSACRFDLGADDLPEDAAPVIVGIKANRLPSTLKTGVSEEPKKLLNVRNLWTFLLRKR